MFEHLANCHGEWNIILAFIGSIPFIGVWLKHKLQGLKKKDTKDEHRGFSD